MDSYRHFIAGWHAGILGVILGHPMDTIKTHQQMSNIKLSSRKVANLIIKRDGFRGFFKGMLFPVVTSGSVNSLYFGVVNDCLKILQFRRGYQNVLPTNFGWMHDLFVAGTIGGFAQALITCPTEFVKIQMQLGKGACRIEKKGKVMIRKPCTYLTILHVYKKFGVTAFFIGFVPTAWRFNIFVKTIVISLEKDKFIDTIGGGLYILSYQCVRHYMYGKLDINPGFFETIVAGGVAGVVSWIPVVPFDTVKSRIQADGIRNPAYKGMIHCGRRLYRQSSYIGFFKGFCMITFRSVPVNIAILYGYELNLWISRQLETSYITKSSHLSK